MSHTKVARRRAAHQPRSLPQIPECNAERVGAFNAYVCPQGHFTVTVDLDVTPSGMSCLWPGCDERARSCWYRGVPDHLTPTHEWYRPGDAQRRTLNAYQADHVNRGGLLLRRRGSALGLA